MVIPIITIDGPSASGKGTIAKQLAATLNWHLLDSGALYRIVAWVALQRSIDINDRETIANLPQQLTIHFEPNKIYVDQQDVTQAIRSETVGETASNIATDPKLRTNLLTLQRNFATPPGLVADGRDMGTVVFPDAAVKFFLTASVEIRAQRRMEQLKISEKTAKIDEFLNAIKARDLQDAKRKVAPLIQAKDAILIDSSHRSIEQVITMMLFEINKKLAL